MKAKLSIVPILAVLLIGCSVLGLAPAKSFDEGWSYAQAKTTALRDASTRALDAHLITSGDMEYCIAVADRSSQMLNLARRAMADGDLPAAEARLALVTNILAELELYLTQRGAK